MSLSSCENLLISKFTLKKSETDRGIGIQRNTIGNYLPELSINSKFLYLNINRKKNSLKHVLTN